jgi:hypothetical protein
MKALGYALGGGLILLGFIGLVSNSGQTDPLSWALWFGGGVAVHDLLLVPVVLALGVPASRLRAPYRTALVVAGLVSIVALPVVLGLGRRADNPSQLPLNYAADLAGVIAGIVLVAAVADGCARLRRRRRAHADRQPHR